jgi:hypothetical protein
MLGRAGKNQDEDINDLVADLGSKGSDNMPFSHSRPVDVRRMGERAKSLVDRNCRQQRSRIAG